MLESLSLERFRNFEEASLHLSSKNVAFTGTNGQGKTTLLEAIFFLSNLRSFRTTQTKDLKRIGEGYFKIGASIVKDGSWRRRLEVEYGCTKNLRVDGIPVFKASDFARKFKTIAFLPDDTSIITGASAVRRRFIDMFISMSSPAYFNSLQSYFSALQSRNFLLKSGRLDINLLSSYSSVLSSVGSAIVSERMKFIDMLSNSMGRLVLEMKPEASSFEVKYRHPAGSNDKGLFMSKLETSVEKDRQRGFTGYGPHVDDIEFILDGKMLRIYGSRGQCRTASLCLKMAEFEIVSKCCGGSDDAVILIDDATGDLDPRTKGLFLESISGAGQIFHAFTDIDEAKRIDGAQIFEISNSSIKSSLQS